MTTYVGIRHIGQKQTTVVRTEESRRRASHRAVLRTPDFVPKFSAQEVADEKNLSRSKPYPNKGRREAARRVEQMDKLLGVDGVLTASESAFVKAFRAA
jgi:hypothetical protein